MPLWPLGFPFRRFCFCVASLRFSSSPAFLSHPSSSGGDYDSPVRVMSSCVATLTPSVIQQRTKQSDLNAVRNLNLWGMSLADVSVLAQLPNIEVLSLSVNKISSLRDFANCPRLTELYLRKNEIADIDELAYLRHMPSLKVLWLSDNPVADQPGYHDAVREYAPQLTKLDNVELAPSQSQQQHPEPEEVSASPVRTASSPASRGAANANGGSGSGAAFARRELIPRDEGAAGSSPRVNRAGSYTRSVSLPASYEPAPSPRRPTTPSVAHASPQPPPASPPPPPSAAAATSAGGAHGCGPQSNIMYAVIGKYCMHPK